MPVGSGSTGAGHRTGFNCFPWVHRSNSATISFNLFWFFFLLSENAAVYIVVSLGRETHTIYLFIAHTIKYY